MSLRGQGIVTDTCALAPPTRTPDLTLTLGGSYTLDLPEMNWWLTASANYRRISRMNVGTSGLPSMRVASSNQVNAGLTLGVGDGLRLTLECENCNNELIQHSVLAGTYYYNEPRRISFRLRWDT